MPKIVDFPTSGLIPAEPAEPADRRLVDKVTVAFNQACDQHDPEVATRLLDVLEFIWSRDQALPPGQRRAVNYLLGARARLRHIRHATQAAAIAAGPDE